MKKKILSKKDNEKRRKELIEKIFPNVLNCVKKDPENFISDPKFSRIINSVLEIIITGKFLINYNFKFKK